LKTKLMGLAKIYILLPLQFSFLQPIIRIHDRGYLYPTVMEEVGE